MGRKNTLKANKVPEPKIKLYLVAFTVGDKVDREEFRATHIDTDHESLKAWLGKELIGEFREWVYYVRLDEGYDKDEEYTENPKLPPKWGYVDGKPF